MQRQRTDVLRPFPQRRQANGYHIEPIKQITPEDTALHVLLKVTVGGSHHPHHDLDLALAAEPDNRALLQRSQKLGLHRQRHLANFIEKNRTPVGLFKPAGTRRLRAGKCTALEAKQFRLKQRVRDGCAIDLDKRLVAPLARQMHCTRKQLFAGARFTQQQHAGRGLGYTFQLAECLQQRR